MDEVQICKANLDKKVNGGETLREFIKKSIWLFYGYDISDEEIDSWDEITLVGKVDFLDYLWTK